LYIRNGDIKMDRTIENIKKILHISPKKKKGGEDYFDIAPSANDKVLTIDTTDQKEKVSNRSNNEIPVMIEDVTEYDIDCIKCEGCSKPMEKGNEISLSNGLCWHYKCFNCDNCGVDVSEQKYAVERGCLLCAPCIQKKVRTTCYKCVLTIEMEDTKLIVDGREFHKSCFACSVCSVQLESVYGCKEGQYFCESCYIEKFGKKCAQCEKVILGEGLRFGESNFHRDCFTCSDCSCALQQGSVHSIRQRPVCPLCYEKQFLDSCKVCQQTVAEGLKFRDQKFHHACFKCRHCDLLLADRKGDFLLTEIGLECKECVKNKMSEDIQSNAVTENCVGCKLPIHVKNLVFDGENNWHYKCFCCSQCGSALVGQKYYDKGGRLFCNNCFLAEYLPTCYSCKAEIKGSSGVKMASSSGQVLTWHEHCLECSQCNSKLDMSNVVFNEMLFCKSCYLDKMLEKCDKCKKSITGVGFSFRGKSWHDSCFACDKCGTVFEEGKFRALRNEKLCEACFKASTHIN